MDNNVAIQPDTLVYKPLRVVNPGRDRALTYPKTIYNKIQQTFKLWQLRRKGASQPTGTELCSWGGLLSSLSRPAGMNAAPPDNGTSVRNNVPSMKGDRLNEQVS